MEKVFQFEYQGYKVYGVGVIENNCDTVVLFLHGVPGDRVDSRRLPITISRRLNSVGINTVRVDLFATSFSEGDYSEVTLSNFYECTICIIKQIENIYKNICHFYLVAFSEAGKIALRVHDKINAAGICLCNAILTEEASAEELAVNKYYRRDNKFVVNIGFGTWISSKLLREMKEWCYKLEDLPACNYLYIYGLKDIQTINTRGMLKQTNNNLILLENEDHLFTSGTNDEIIASHIASWMQNSIIDR